MFMNHFAMTLMASCDIPERCCDPVSLVSVTRRKYVNRHPKVIDIGPELCINDDRRSIMA